MQSNFSSFVSFLFANVVIIFQNATLLAKKLVIFEKKFLLCDKTNYNQSALIFS